MDAVSVTESEHRRLRRSSKTVSFAQNQPLDGVHPWNRSPVAGFPSWSHVTVCSLRSRDRKICWVIKPPMQLTKRSAIRKRNSAVIFAVLDVVAADGQDGGG